MRKILFASLLLIAQLCSSRSAQASHIYGLDFYYTHLGNDLYRITLDVYGDCLGASFPFLMGAAPEIEVMDHNDNDRLLRYMYLGLTDTTEVTPTCTALAGISTCTDPLSSVPGVKRFRYTDTVTISRKSTGLRIRFRGLMGNSYAGRTGSMTNISIDPVGGSITVIQLELNNTLPGANSSPQFTTVPTPFYCINIPQLYNQGSVDADGDSLRYEMALPLETYINNLNVTQPVTYLPGYGHLNPLHVAPGSFSFNPATGQMGFTPDQVQQSLVVNKVTEYRNGVMVGSAIREMTFIVRPDCNNSPPVGGITAPVTGASWNGGSNVRICQNGGTLSFHIKPTDPEGATVTLQTNGLNAFPGATPTISVTGNGTTHPDLLFSWNVGNVPIGTYTFYVNAKDDGCPQPSQQTQAFTVEVIGKPVLVATVTQPTNCYYKAKLNYALSSGIPPYTVSIYQGSTLLHTFPATSASQLSDSLPAGTYTAQISSPSSGLPCNGTYSFTVADSGTYPFPPRPDSQFYCLYDAPHVLTATPVPGATLSWFTESGIPLPVAPTPSTGTPGIFRWLVSQKVLVCPSKADTAMVYVTPIPVADFEAPDPWCTRDTATVRFTGFIGVGPIIGYEWNWDGASYVSGAMGGPYRVRWETPGLKTIRLRVLENKCPSSEVKKDILIRPKPVAGFSAPDICAEDTLELRHNATALAGQSYAWTFQGTSLDSSRDAGPFRLRWDMDGKWLVTLKVELDGCSDSLAKRITVFPKPEAFMSGLPADPCLGDKIYLSAAGGTSYRWTPEDRIFKEPDGRLYTIMMVPAVYSVTAINEHGCSDSIAKEVRNIQPCCTFSYPNAFSPNGDGRNDGFRVILYGNPYEYDLSIYNRWGERVFHSYEPKFPWDGTFRGVPCEVGTYMYKLKAKCMTGHEEEQAGDVVLIR